MVDVTSGTCPEYPSIASLDWFDDSLHGGPTATTSAACADRVTVWKEVCDNHNVIFYFNS